MIILLLLATTILIMAVVIPIGNYIGIKLNNWLQKTFPNITE